MPTPKDFTIWSINTFANEDIFQAACIKMISQEFPKLRFKVWHTQNEQHIPRVESEILLPNDSPATRFRKDEAYKQRCMRIGNMNKAKGKLAGVMDILITHNGILYKLELKQPDGSLQESQETIHKIWNKDCPNILVQVAYCLLHAYLYCRWIVDTNLTINFPNNYQSFEYEK